MIFQILKLLKYVMYLISFLNINDSSLLKNKIKERNQVILIEDTEIMFGITIDKQNSRIIGEIHASEDGFTAIGTGVEMEDSNMFVVEFDDNDNLVVNEYYSKGHKTPELVQNIKWKIDSLRKNGSKGYIVVFSRAINPKNNNHLDKLQEGENNFIYNYSKIVKKLAFHGPKNKFGDFTYII